MLTSSSLRLNLASCAATGLLTHETDVDPLINAAGERVKVNADHTVHVTAQGRRSTTLTRNAITHRLNVEKVYADLGGDANPDEVGFVRAWKEAVRG